MWYLDSGCSRHMTSNVKKFSKISCKANGYDTYDDNNKGKILGAGKVKNSSFIVVKNVLFVEGLKHNLLSINQLCDKGLRVTFETNHCLICFVSSNEIVLIGRRIQNIYTIDFENIDFNSIICLFAKKDDSWI